MKRKDLIALRIFGLSICIPLTAGGVLGNMKIFYFGLSIGLILILYLYPKR